MLLYFLKGLHILFESSFILRNFQFPLNNIQEQPYSFVNLSCLYSKLKNIRKNLTSFTKRSRLKFCSNFWIDFQTRRVSNNGTNILGFFDSKHCDDQADGEPETLRNNGFINGSIYCYQNIGMLFLNSLRGVRSAVLKATPANNDDYPSQMLAIIKDLFSHIETGSEPILPIALRNTVV